MKKHKLLLLVIILSLFSYSQDTIVRTNGKKILAKVLSIKGNKIEYKNYNYQSGPIITIYKVKVWKIIYPNGQEEVIGEPDFFSNIQDSINNGDDAKNRKGVYMGFSYTPGFGSIFPENEELPYYYEIKEKKKKYSYSYGLNIEYSFSNNYALKIGLYTSTYTFYEQILISNYNIGLSNFKYQFQEITIPVNLKMTFGSKAAFNVDIGFMFNIPRHAYITNQSTNNAVKVESFKKISISENTNVYLTIPFTQSVVFGIGAYQSYGLTSYSKNEKAHNIMYGFLLNLNVKMH
jgi:hypothetical protein